MQYFEAIMIMFGGIGALLIGMAMLSDNMRRIANTRLKKMFNKTSNNRLLSFSIGLGATAVVQSSGITTVMVVGLVNAGVLSLLQATAIIMGANVGTTITAHIAALQTFDFIVASMALTLIGTFIVLLSHKEKVKTIGRVLSGIGMVFIALHLLGSSMDAFRDNETIITALTSLTNPVFLVLIGLIITAIFQSSSAITAIIISMAIAGITIGDGGNDVLYVILGTNIGTTFTAVLSSIGTNTNAKRASVIHFLFNTFGSIVFIVILILWPTFKSDVLASMFPHEATQIAMFHTLFNVVCSMLFLPFAQVFIYISKKLIPDKEHKHRSTDILDERLLKTPSIALLQLRKEILIMADMAMTCLKNAFNAFTQNNVSVKESIQDKIKEVNKINTQITAYLVKLSGETLNFEEKIESSSLYHVIADLERISDLADNITKYTDAYVYQRLNFTDLAIEDLKKMFSIIEELYQVTIDVFANPALDKHQLVNSLEQTVDDMRKYIIDSHIMRLNQGVCSPESSPILINLVSNLERAADHMNFIAQTKH